MEADGILQRVEIVGLGVGAVGGVGIAARDGRWYLALMSVGVLLLIYEVLKQRRELDQAQPD